MATKCKYCKGTGSRLNYWNDEVGTCGFCDGSGVRKPTEAAQAAALIRAELKKAFPGTKFAIRSRNFAGGDAVDVDWTDGPTRDQVEAITGKYNAGSFDGMIDLYTYGPKKDHATAKYVQTQRSMSKDALRAVVAEINAQWGYALEVDEQSNYAQVTAASDKPASNGNGWQSHEVYRAFQGRAF